MKPPRKVSADCPVCGKVYFYYLSRPIKHCSMACCNVTRGVEKTRARCPQCNKEFEHYPSWPRKYCSNVCKGKANIGNIAHYAPTGFETVCQQCGKLYSTTPKKNRGMFCSLTCFGKWQSIHKTGDCHPNRGRKFGRPKYLPPPTTVSCEVCGSEFVVKPSHVAIRRTCSKKCYGIIQAKENSGENSATWRGGYEPYYGASWREARRQARERDKVCVDCGKSPDEEGSELDVHHIVRFRNFGRERYKEANDLSNLVTLCPRCHSRREWSTNRT